MRLSIRCIFVVGALVTALAHAAKPEDWSETELNMAAPYCIYTEGFRYSHAAANSSKALYWESMMGKNFKAMHHYCWALVNLARAERSSMPDAQRAHLRNTAVDDINFVLQNTARDFVLLPEIYTRLGSVQLILRSPKKAEQAFKTAIALKPDYWPPYVRWAGYLMSTNERSAARKVVYSGLEHAPQAKSLIQLWKELGGGSLPTPVAAKIDAEPAEVALETQGVDRSGGGLGSSSATQERQ